MESALVDRARQLLEQASLKELSKAGDSDYTRWQNIKRGRARLAAEEIETLNKVFPQYRWWLMTGEVMPEIGQTSPDYEIADAKLQGRSGE